jgi:hypothetical protein
MEYTIELLNFISPQNVFTKIESSVISSQGNYSNIHFNEEFDIIIRKIPDKKFFQVLKIGSNFGEVFIFPNIYSPPSLYEMITSIKTLKGKNILIGCYCQNNLNTEEILVLLSEIDASPQYKEIYKTYFTLQNLERVGIPKTRINKVLKSMLRMLEFKITDKETITELYNICEMVVNKTDILLYNKYLDLIVKIITAFTRYAKKCTCWKKCEYNSIFSPPVKKYKSKHKKLSKRKRQGSGLYFSSQITFEIYNNSSGKINKIKLFRNGTFQVPGIKFPDMRDLVPTLIILKNYWNSLLQDPSMVTEIDYVFSNMRNYKCNLIDSTVTILLNRLEDILSFEKDMPVFDMEKKEFLELVKFLDLEEPTLYKVFEYMNVSFFQISEISNNPERYPGILVKLHRPIPSKKNKKITIKILSSGKLNFDGGNSELEILELYHWIQHIFIKYWNEIIFDPKKYLFQTISTDSEDYNSVYDSE